MIPPLSNGPSPLPGSGGDAAPGFSVEKKELRPRRFAAKREWRLLITLPVAVVILVVIIHGWVKNLEELKASNEFVFTAAKLDPMPALALAGHKLPSADEIAAQTGEAERLASSPGELPLMVGGDDALSLAWARVQLARDAAAPPVPMQVVARDLVLRQVRGTGTAVAVGGRLEDIQEAAPGGPWRLLLAIDEGQFAQAMTWDRPGADLVLGRGVRVIGRTMGFVRLPVAAGAAPAATAAMAAGGVEVPLLAARLVRPDASVALAEDGMAEFRSTAAWRLPADLWDDVNDERTYLETRPYYHMLGQARLDLTSADPYAGLKDGNKVANDIHQDPANHRGKPFLVTGYVYQSWEDAEVARDQPFGVARVVRILLWRRDVGNITEVVNGKPKTSMQQVLRIYELAVIGNQPPPEPGTMITATGRFLKFHAIPVEPNRLRDQVNGIRRQTDRVYTFFFTSNGWVVQQGPRNYDFGAWTIALVIAVFSAVAWLVWWSRRESRMQDQVLDQVRKLRQQRRTVARK